MPHPFRATATTRPARRVALPPLYRHAGTMVTGGDPMGVQGSRSAPLSTSIPQQVGVLSAAVYYRLTVSLLAGRRGSP